MLSTSSSLTGLALILLLVASGGAAAPSNLRVGQPFPSLTLPALEDGRPLSLTDFQGEKIMLHVFASW